MTPTGPSLHRITPCLALFRVRKAKLPEPAAIFDETRPFKLSNGLSDRRLPHDGIQIETFSSPALFMLSVSLHVSFQRNLHQQEQPRLKMFQRAIECVPFQLVLHRSRSRPSKSAGEGTIGMATPYKLRKATHNFSSLSFVSEDRSRVISLTVRDSKNLFFQF